MITAILGFLTQSWVGTLVTGLITWWQNRQAAIASALSGMYASVTAHASDGALSVEEHDSAQEQDADLDAQASALDAQAAATVQPPPTNDITVLPPEAPTTTQPKGTT